MATKNFMWSALKRSKAKPRLIENRYEISEILHESLRQVIEKNVDGMTYLPYGCFSRKKNKFLFNRKKCPISYKGHFLSFF